MDRWLIAIKLHRDAGKVGMLQDQEAELARIKITEADVVTLWMSFCFTVLAGLLIICMLGLSMTDQ